MSVPLAVLAVFALGVGAVVGPTGRFGDYLAWTFGLTAGEGHKIAWTPMLLGTAAALIGIAGAWVAYVASPDLPGRMAYAWRTAYEWSLNKFYFDELYTAVEVRPLEQFAEQLRSAAVANIPQADHAVGAAGTSVFPSDENATLHIELVRALSGLPLGLGAPSSARSHRRIVPV